MPEFKAILMEETAKKGGGNATAASLFLFCFDPADVPRRLS